MNLPRNSLSGLQFFIHPPSFHHFSVPIKCATQFFSARVVSLLISRLPRRLGRTVGQAFISRPERESESGLEIQYFKLVHQSLGVLAL